MFSGQSFDDYYCLLWDKVRGEILNEPDGTILGTSPDDLTEYYYSRDALQPLETDPDREVGWTHDKGVRTVPAHEREYGHQNEGDLQFEFESVTVSVPIIHNEHITLLQRLLTSTYTLDQRPGANLNCGPDVITRTFDIKGYGFRLDDDQVAREVKGANDRILRWISWVKNDIEKGNAALRGQIRAFIDERKQKIESDKVRLAALVEMVKIPLKKREDPAATRVRLDRKPLVRRVKPSPKLPEDYVLDRERVADIVTLIDNQCRQMEKTPRSFSASQEEDLRNVLLVGLNGIFEGRATGETFLSRGKTDIYLNIDKGNILVCECKFWDGEGLYHETIDQLLGYLTWRQNYGIMITFSRRKDFTKVLAQVQGVTERHRSYRRGFRTVSAAHFVSIHVLPTDAGKEVEIHHLFYNLG